MTVLNTADALRLGSQRADAAYVGNSLVWETLERQVKRMYAGGIPGVMLDPWTRTNNYQDAARTTLVSVAGDPIGSTTDLSGNGNHASQSTSPKRPLWNDGADLDGADDALVTPSIDFTGTDKITVVVGLTARGDFGMVVELSANSDAQGGFYVFTGASMNTKFQLMKTGGGAAYTARTRSVAAAAPTTEVWSAIFDYAGATRNDEVAAQINGGSVSMGTAAGQGDPSGVFQNAPIHIGMRGGFALPFNGNIKRTLVIGRALTASELSIAERWANEPVGVL